MEREILIRSYNSDDKDAILHLVRLNTPKYFDPKEEDDLIHYLDNEIEQYFVVESDGQVIGSGGYNFADDKRTGIISWDILHPSVHGQGTGTRLLQYRIDQLQNMHKVEKIIVRTSQISYGFYQKSGFKLLDIVKDHWAEGYDMYRMEYTK